MSSQDRQPSYGNEVNNQTSDEHVPVAASAAELPQETETVQGGSQPGDLLQLSEQLAGKRFARDINAKIDEVEDQVQFLVEAFSRSQRALKGVMGDLQSQAVSMTSEVERVIALVNNASDVQAELVGKLDQRLKATVAELNGKLASVDGQLQAHQGEIGQLKLGLEDSHSRLIDQIDRLEAESNRKLESLSRQAVTQEQELSALATATRQGFESNKNEHQALRVTQREQQDAQRAMSEHLGVLQEQVNSQGDGLSELGVTTVQHQRVTRKHFRMLSGAGAVIVLLFAGVLVYLQQIPYAQNEHVLGKLAGLESEVGDLSTGLDAATLTTDQQFEVVADSIDDVSRQMASLETQLGSLEGVSGQVAALELSVYGPDDGGLPAIPALTIHGADWVADRPAGHYSIQLLGAYRKGSLVAYTNQHAEALGEFPLSTTESEYRGRTWYNLFYGDFSSFNAALAVLESLPSDLQRNGPWIRSLSSIQQ